MESAGTKLRFTLGAKSVYLAPPETGTITRLEPPPLAERPVEDWFTWIICKPTFPVTGMPDHLVSRSSWA